MSKEDAISMELWKTKQVRIPSFSTASDVLFSFLPLDTSIALLQSLGCLYDILDGKNQRLLLQTVSKHVSMSRLSQLGWEIKRTKYRSAKQSVERNSGIIKQTPKPSPPPSKQSLMREA